MTEGEKAVDLLRDLGFTATCGSAGTSWRAAWTDTLWRMGCENVIVLSDND